MAKTHFLLRAEVVHACGAALGRNELGVTGIRADKRETGSKAQTPQGGEARIAAAMRESQYIKN